MPTDSSGDMQPKKKRANNRTRGHNLERKFAKVFRDELGYTFCKTTRESSRLLDNCKIDLSNAYGNIQLKKGYENQRPKADKIFDDMKALLSENFPKDDPIHKLPKVLIHEMNPRDDHGCLVTMTFDDWKELIKKANKCNDE